MVRHSVTGALLSNRKRELLRDSYVKIDHSSYHSTPLWLDQKLAACHYRNGCYWAKSNWLSFALLLYTRVIKYQILIGGRAKVEHRNKDLCHQ